MFLCIGKLLKIHNYGIKYYDFGRSPFQSGTYNFKLAWGAIPVSLKYYQINDSKVTQLESHDKDNITKLISIAWSKTPSKITNFLGPKIRKYIY
jgi:hypothetical protein